MNPRVRLKSLVNSLIIFREIISSFKTSIRSETKGPIMEMGSIAKAMKSTGILPVKRHHRFGVITARVLVGITLAICSKTFFNLFSMDSWRNEGTYQYLGYLSAATVLIIFLTMIFRSNKTEEILIFMEDSWERAESLTSEEERRIIEDSGKKTRCIIKILWCILAVMFMSQISMPWVTWHVTDEPLQLHSDVWLNTTYMSEPVFATLMTGQILSTAYMALLMIVEVGFSIIIVRHCQTQLKLLAYKMRNYRGVDRHSRTSRNRLNSRYDCSCSKCIVERHIEIVEFFQLIKQYLNPLISISSTAIAVIIYVAIFMVFKKTDHDSIVYIIYCWIYAVCILSISLLSHLTAEDLRQESLKLGDAIYDSPWYSINPKNRKSCVIMMIYANNTPMGFTNCFLYAYGNEHFREFLFRAYSVLSLCRALNAKDSSSLVSYT